MNQSVQKSIFSLTYINSVYLYNGAQDLIYSSKTGEQSSTSNFYDQKLIDFLEQTDRLKQSKRQPFAHNTNSMEDSPNVCSYVLPVWEPTNPDQLKSSLVINISVDSLINTIQAINQAEDDLGTQFLVVNQEGQVLGSPNSDNTITKALVEQKTPHQFLLLPEVQNRIATENKSYFTFHVDKEKYLVMFNELTQNDWTLVGLYQESDLFSDVRKASYLSLGTLFVLFSACILFGLLNAKRISQPIQNISDKIKENFGPTVPTESEDMNELELIQTVFSNMEEQSKQFEALRQESNYALKQELLSGLISGNTVHTMERVTQRLEYLNLSFIAQSPLRILVLQIDDYQNFQSRYNPRERWAYRYAVTNLVSEITKEEIQSVVFSQDSDKFVMLVDDTSLSQKQPEKELEALLEKIRDSFRQHLELSISVAYSDPFDNVVHIAREYEKLMDLLQLRVKYGFGCLLKPCLLEEQEYGSLEIPPQKEAALFLAINKAEQKEAVQILEELLQIILPYSYDEIMYYINHLAYAINEDVVSKNIDSRIEIHEIFQKHLTAIAEAETLQQIEEQFKEYIQQLCVIVAQKQETKSNMQIMTGRILEIVDEQYTDPNLSLNTLANQLDLSPKYVGRMFRETTGTSVASYLLSYRLDLVGEAIRNQQYQGADTLEQVGLEFNNYFYTCFKSHFGITLSEYRDQYPESSVAN